ncbi:tail protein [Bacteriophage Lily]|uniref:Tail protein n=1 Tax=Bacteriophage Lily TaxID=1589751 RepID=A0A0C5AEF4_9CAUD|nr:baseplate hub [Bacteriophage Lily]AJK27742.1 tail protein [Bacteriophage Lily]
MTTYTTIQGDTWSTVAYKVYQDEKLLTVLINANLDHVNTVVFSAGVRLAVPSRPAEIPSSLPPWKRVAT